MLRLHHIGCSLFLACAIATPGVAAAASNARPAGPGVALIELFTSEGCSSCPPADALLERVVIEARQSGQRVYALSFHVDYWDYLGWKDRFSSAAFTQRQRLYAHRFGLASLYTPQMVVNGAREFVGSNRITLQSAIHDALSSAAAATLKLSASATGHDVAVGYETSNAPAGATLNLAWVDAREASAPDRGENQGRALGHVNVVRELRSVELKRAIAGTVHLTRPDIVDGAVIAWIQAAPAEKVLGAASVAVPQR